MTQELLERTVRDWVEVNPNRGARELGRLASEPVPTSPEAIANALIDLAARTHFATSRAW